MIQIGGIKTYLLEIVGLGVFIILGIFFSFPAQAFVPPVDIDVDTVWSKVNGPYVLYLETIIKPGVTLTIEPGTIIKSHRSGSLTVQGTLQAVGTSDNPIIFTSAKDDAAGGDTNGDGFVTVPTPGEWRWIYFAPESDGIIEYASISYGGYYWFEGHQDGQIIVESSSPTLKNLTIKDGHNSGYGLRLINSMALVENNDIANNFSNYDIIKVGSYGIWVDGGAPKLIGNKIHHNGKGGLVFVDNTVPLLESTYINNNRIYTNSDLYFKFLGRRFGLINGSSTLIDARNNWWGDDSGPKVEGNPNGQGQEIYGNPVLYDPWIGKGTKTPVLLVPGIISTELKKGNDLLWLDLSQVLVDIGDDFLDVLALDEDGVPIDSSVVKGDIIRRLDIPLLPDYDIWEGLIAELKTNGYQEGIDLFFFPYDWRLDLNLTSQELNNKINEIRTLTGSNKVNVVAHSMGGLVTKKYILENIDHGINKLIFVGTPHLGAPKALKSLMFGEEFGIPLLSLLKMKELSLNMFSNYQLLPSREYFNKINEYFADLSSGIFQPFNYNGIKAFLIKEKYNKKALNTADNFHSSNLDNLDLSSLGINTYNISGCNSPAILGIVRLSSTTAEDKYALRFGPGDGTVPFISSTAVISDKEFYIKDADHGKMPSQETVRKLVGELLSDSPDYSDILSGLITDKNECKISGKLISVHSPVDLNIYDSNGNHIGPDNGGGFEENIPGAVYEVLGGNKFVFLPTLSGEDFNIKLNATSEGSFDLRIKSIVDNNTMQTVYYDSIDITSVSEGEMIVNSSSEDTTLSLDFSGNGEYETINASAVLGPNESLDLTQPESSVSLSGTIGNNGWFRSEVAVELSATDDNSGVLKTEYSIDNENWQIYEEPFVVSENGSSTILYRSTDKAGNTEIAKTKTINIDTISPEAEIKFNLNTLELEIIGKDNASSVYTTQIDDTFVIQDEAGNTTELALEQWQKKKSFRAVVTSLRYNGTESLQNIRNKFIYNWSYNKLGVLKKFVQKVMVKKDFSAVAIYIGKTDQTKFITKSIDGRIKEFYSGLISLIISTNKGKFIYAIE